MLVAINQPFTIWMLRSFLVNIPQELDEAAMVDGCTRLPAFRRVIIPVMWPEVVTTGLFSFLLAYNDFMLSSALTNADRMTMPAAIASHRPAELFDSRKTVHFKSEVPTAAAALDTTLDAGGRLARRSLLPPSMMV